MEKRSWAWLPVGGFWFLSLLVWFTLSLFLSLSAIPLLLVAWISSSFLRCFLRNMSNSKDLCSKKNSGQNSLDPCFWLSNLPLQHCEKPDQIRPAAASALLPALLWVTAIKWFHHLKHNKDQCHHIIFQQCLFQCWEKQYNGGWVGMRRDLPQPRTND